MEKQDIQEKGKMEVEGQQRQEDDLGNSSADEEESDKEESLQLLQKDREILLGLLPADCWLDVNKMLLDDHCNDDLKNLCNSSPFFRDLLFSQRVIFLFPEVLKVFGAHLEKEEDTSEEDKSSIIFTCRSVCKFWNKSVDHWINASLKPDFFHDPPTVPSVPRNPALIAARYKYFGFMAPHRLQRFLDHFDRSHQSDDAVPQRNPFIGTTVALCNENYYTEHPHFEDNVVNLLKKYGKHPRVMCLGLSTTSNYYLRSYLWLKECLELVPNLTHLKVKQRPINQDWNRLIGMDPYFGEHAYRNVPTEEYLRRRILSEMASLPAETIQRIITSTLQLHQEFLSGVEVEERQVQNYDMDEDLATDAQLTGDISGLWRIHLQEREQRELEEENAPPPPPPLNADQLRNVVAGDPLPVLKNLECLKLCRLYARVFNPLIQSNLQVSWLHIEPLVPWPWLDRYVDWWTFDFPNLRKLYIKFSGGPEEVRRMRNFHPSFLKVTSLHLEYPSERRDYMGWAEIFQIIEENWADTVVELKIRLPEPKSEQDKMDGKNAVENGRLALPKLKRLVMWRSGLQGDAKDIRNFNFLNSMRENLDEFVVL